MSNTVHSVGATSKILTFRAVVISTGLPYTAGVFNTATISASYCKDGSTPTAITLVTATQGTWTSSGFVHRHKGVYELGAPNLAFSTTVDGVTFTIDGIADVLWEVVRVELVGVDPRSATAPDVNVLTINSQTATAGAGVTFPSSIASPTNITTAALGATERSAIAAAVQTSAAATPLPADVKKINATTVNGNGAGTPWGP